MSTRASPTSAPTMTLARRRDRRPRDDPLLVSCSTEATSVRMVRRAGAKLKMRLHRTATPAVKPTTTGSMPMSSTRGNPWGSTLFRSEAPPHATNSPASPPIEPNTTPSSRECRMRWTGEAPKAADTAVLLPRSADRTRRRLATFAHPMRSTRLTAPNSTQTVAAVSPRSWSRAGTRVTDHPSLESGYSRASSAAMASISVRARSSLTPSLNRPTVLYMRWGLESRFSRSRVRGDHASTSVSPGGKEKPRGMTPTKV